MAISSYPTPVDAGVLCVILANTAVSISIFKEIFRSILHVFGVHFTSWEEFSSEPSESRKSPSEAYMEDFRSQTPKIRYSSIFLSDCTKQDCSICLVEFESSSEIHRLTCGHLFHNLCLEKWLKCWKTTCPLCRNYIMPQDMEEDACPT